jgi:dethiobiotin synthetase
MSRGLFITGTGTGVGKTYVSALIAKSLVAAGKKVGVYKPVASGCELRDGTLVSADAVGLWEAAGRPGTLEQVCPQLFAAPLAPHLAARAEGKRVDAALLRSGLDVWRESFDIVLVEGAGGLMSPISDDDYNADLAEEFGLPLVVVAANVLGTINATLQTLIVADTFRNGLSVAGIILNSPQPIANDPSTDSNADELARRCVAPLLANVAFEGQLEPTVDWWSLAQPAST